MKWLVALALLSAGAARAGWEPPTKGEIASLVLVEIAIAWDIGQTVRFRRGGLRETNPLLGEQPSTERVILLGGIIPGLIAAGAWYAAPNPGLRYTLCGTILFFEVLAIKNNSSIGYTFPW